MKLYGYWRSGTSYRVRLALHYKGIEVEYLPVNLKAGEQLEEAYREKNPSAGVPLLVLDDGTQIAQSTAIIEYLEERIPEPALLPIDAEGRARVRQLCNIIACDIHPLQNLRVQKYLKNDLGITTEESSRWLQQWIGQGLAAYEAELAQDSRRGGYSVGHQFTMAECFLIPQLYSARRFGLDLEAYPNILAVEEATMGLPFVDAALPDTQPDFSG